MTDEASIIRAARDFLDLGPFGRAPLGETGAAA